MNIARETPAFFHEQPDKHMVLEIKREASRAISGSRQQKLRALEAQSMAAAHAWHLFSCGGGDVGAAEIYSVGMLRDADADFSGFVIAGSNFRVISNRVVIFQGVDDISADALDILRYSGKLAPAGLLHQLVRGNLIAAQRCELR